MNEFLNTEENSPLCLLVYGKPGVGKTSLAGQFPNAILFDLEGGSKYVKTKWKARDLKDYDDFLTKLKKIESSKEIETVIIDSMDWLEEEIKTSIMKKYKSDNLATAGGGFGAGYQEVQKLQVAVKDVLKNINKTKHLVLIAHDQIKPFNDPKTDVPYDRHILKMAEKSNALWTEFVDGVFFITKEVFTTGKGKEARATAEDGRYIYTSETTAFDAKTRVKMPDRIKFEESGMFELIQSYFNVGDKGLFEKLTEDVEKVRDEEVKAYVKKKLPEYKNNILKLKEIQTYIEGK